jgi:hypothetical protein
MYPGRGIYRLLIQTNLVRDEGALVERPQQVIERLRIGQSVIHDDDAHIAQISFFGQSASQG